MNPGNNEHIQTTLHGHSKFLKQFCMAKQTKNLHHAYLLHGNIGIGKSFLAKQLAVYLLENGANDILFENSTKHDEVELVLGLNQSNSVWRQVFYHSHPDLVYLSASKSEQNKSGQIKLEDIKSIAGLTNHQSGRGGWRIVIIDSIDETNRNGSNAILKILEEPPDKTIFFLISHNVYHIIPTIRSRCRQVKLRPLLDNETRLILKKKFHDIGNTQLEQLVLLCDGSPGMAISIYKSGVETYIDDLVQILHQGKSGLEEILQLAGNWGNNISRKPDLSSSTRFIFDKLFSEAALLASKDNSCLKEQTSNSISKIIIALAHNYTAEELANLYTYWQTEYHAVQTNYLDMGIFMQQTFYKIYSQMHIR